jgi:hypothetical protein
MVTVLQFSLLPYDLIIMSTPRLTMTRAALACSNLDIIYL